MEHDDIVQEGAQMLEVDKACEDVFEESDVEEIDEETVRLTRFYNYISSDAFKRKSKEEQREIYARGLD